MSRLSTFEVLDTQHARSAIHRPDSGLSGVTHRGGFLWIWLCSCWLCWSSVWFCVPQTAVAQTAARAPGRSTVLVRVDGLSLTQGELEDRFKARRVPVELQPKVRAEFIEQLIDERLLRRFLASQKITVNPDEVEVQVQQLLQLLSPDDQRKLNLAEFGYTEKTLREELSLPLLWRNYLNKTLTADDYLQRFEAQKSRYDGTRVRARQILKKVNTREPSPELTAARQELGKIREQIVSGSVKFAAAAAQHSDAPSRDKGGDVGLFSAHDGLLPKTVSAAAFELKIGEVSPVVESPFGLHLIEVSEILPGDLSPEDARPQIAEDLSRELWTKTVADLRSKAKIERLVK